MSEKGNGATVTENGAVAMKSGAVAMKSGVAVMKSGTVAKMKTATYSRLKSSPIFSSSHFLFTINFSSQRFIPIVDYREPGKNFLRSEFTR